MHAHRHLAMGGEVLSYHPNKRHAMPSRCLIARLQRNGRCRHNSPSFLQPTREWRRNRVRRQDSLSRHASRSCRTFRWLDLPAHPSALPRLPANGVTPASVCGAEATPRATHCHPPQLVVLAPRREAHAVALAAVERLSRVQRRAGRRRPRSPRSPRSA